MKVLFVHDHKFYRNNDCVYSTKFSKDTWQTYLQDGNQLIVFARESATPCNHLASCDNIKFILTSKFTTAFSAISNYHDINKELETEIQKADCVIIRMPSVLGLFAGRIARKLHKRIMAEVVGNAFDAYWYYGSVLGKIIAPAYSLLNKYVIYHSDYAIYVTDGYLQNKYPCKNQTCACSDVLLNAVDHRVLDARLEKISKISSPIICGEIGNISVPYKGYNIMIRAMAKLRSIGIDIEYHIVGGGNPDTVLQYARKFGLQDRVFYDGIVSPDDIMQFYDRIDIYVHPSFTEGMPRVLIEAISRGCPCVASNAGGIPEIIDGQYLHRIRDVNKLCKDLLSLAKDRETMKDVAIRNFNHARSFYSDRLSAIRMAFYKSFYQK